MVSEDIINYFKIWFFLKDGIFVYCYLVEEALQTGPEDTNFSYDYSLPENEALLFLFFSSLVLWLFLVYIHFI